MPAKKKASEPIETPVIVPVNTKTIKAKGQVIEVNDDDTRIVTTSSTKAAKGKATKAIEAAPTAQVETKATSTKTKAAKTSTKIQPQAAKTPKAPKEKLPRPVTVGRLELAAEVAKAVNQLISIWK